MKRLLEKLTKPKPYVQRVEVRDAFKVAWYLCHNWDIVEARYERGLKIGVIVLATKNRNARRYDC